MNKTLQKKLGGLPKTPGVYFHKDKQGEVIYIGKAAVLKNRVKSYFQKTKNRDPKTEALVLEIVDTDWIEVETEIDALFLEAEMVKRYMPRFNILLRDDKSLSYVRIDHKSDYPTVTLTRRPLDDGADYYGPFMNGYSVKKALRYLRRVFPFAVQGREGAMGSRLYEQLGLDPGITTGKTSLNAYRANLRRLSRYLRGERRQLIAELERDMKTASKNQEFEKATIMRNQLFALKSLSQQVIFSDREFMDMSRDKGLAGLAELLGLAEPPKRIEGFDISHMSGTDTVASMVVFESGMPSKAAYRKFKMRVPGNDDFVHMNEVITRRLSEKHRTEWALPNLFLIDGGKGQLTAARAARDTAGFADLPMIGLAKREEEVVISKQLVVDNLQLIKRVKAQGGTVIESDDFFVVNLSNNSDIVKLLQRIRDESHRFAVSYHSTLKRTRQTSSWLDEVPTIGPATRKKLIKTFGSVRGLTQARHEELVKLVGEKKATILRQYLRANKNQS